MKPIIVVDGNALGHTVKYSLGELEYEDLQIGVVYGFIFRLLHLAREFDTNKFVFAWDSRVNFREELYPEYKNKHLPDERTDDEKYVDSCVRHQFNLLRKSVLPALGFTNIYHQQGMEGDDVIASIIKNNPLEKTIIVSSDKDLYQLLSPMCSMYLLKRKELYTHSDFYKEYGVHPMQWADVKAMAGCSGDKVPGIKGVGNTKALAYIKGQLPKGKIFDKIRFGSDTVIFTRKLVELPFEGTEIIKLKETETFDIDKIINVLENYDMFTLTSGKNYKTWRENFCGFKN